MAIDEHWEEAKKIRDEVKAEWNRLWMEKYHDSVLAEEVSLKEYCRLFVNGGEIIHANRDYKPLSFSAILSKHLDTEMVDRVDLDPRVGGWGKFIREQIPKKKVPPKRERPQIQCDLTQHQRKGGAGWKNRNRISKKKKQSIYNR